MSLHTAVATIHTNKGDIRVNLFGNHAPKTVRNFVELAEGTHRLRFATGAWFEADGRDHLHPEVVVAFGSGHGPHLHVALLLGPWSYTTYRGS